MTLSPGTRLGPYEILSPLGAGGMGEVWKARDGRLGRDVAIKVLPEAFAADAERLARFRHEAQVLASLNHPHIAGIYGLEESGGVQSLVLELVEGETLADRIARGPLPVDEALEIARQIADALEAAQERGIVHRDLKPANVKLTPGGEVKVLDFGLAKGLSAEVSSPDVSHSPTLTAAGTQAGVVIGTAAYMSPEQARGKAVDKRSDIWAFGAVLWEMLTGRRLFEGETVSDILAAVLRQDVDFGALPPETPTGIIRLLHRCLERDPKSRLHDAGDARLEIDDAGKAPAGRREVDARVAPPAAKASALRFLPWILAAAAVLVSMLSLRRRETRGLEDVVRFRLDMPETVLLEPDVSAQSQLLAVSADGRRIAFRGRTGEERRIFVRDLSRETVEAVAGTEGGTDPFFSPDGEWLGFVAEGKLKKTSLRGATPVNLADDSLGRGAAWGPDGTIVFSPTVDSPLYRIPAAGGEPRPLTTLDVKARERTHRWPEFLPDGKTVLFTVGTEEKPGDYDDSRIEAVSLATGKRRAVYRGASLARYAPPGHLLLARHGDVLAVPFDAKAAEVRGTPAPVLQGVSGDSRSGIAYFAAARSGMIVYAKGTSPQGATEIVWIDREGRREATSIPPGLYSELALSPDGKKLAFGEGPAGGARSDIWVADLAHGGEFQLTSTGQAASPRWTPDGKSIVYTTAAGDAILRQAADGNGSPEVIWQSPHRVPITTDSFAPEGSALLFSLIGLRTRSDIWMLPLRGESRARPLIATPKAEVHGMISPNGRWVAYMGEYEAGQQIYVQAYPSLAGRWQISRTGGVAPRWSPAGDELFYASGDQMMRVPIQQVPTFSPGTPQPLFRIERPGTTELRDNYDVTPDGKRFIVIVRREEPKRRPRVEVVLNFQKTLEDAR